MLSESLGTEMQASHCAECENQRGGRAGAQPGADHLSDTQTQSSASSPTRRVSRASASQPLSGAAQAAQARATSPRQRVGAGAIAGAAGLYDNGGGKKVGGGASAAAAPVAAEERERRLLMARHCDCDDCRALVAGPPPDFVDPSCQNQLVATAAGLPPQLISPYPMNPMQLEQMQQMSLQMGLQMPLQMQMPVPMPLSIPPLAFPPPPAGLTFNTLQLTRNPLQQLEQQELQQVAAPAPPAALLQMGTLKRRGSGRGPVTQTGLNEESQALGLSGQRLNSPTGATSMSPLLNNPAAAMGSQMSRKRSPLTCGNTEVSLLRRPLLGTGSSSRDRTPSPAAVNEAATPRQNRSGSGSGTAMSNANASLVRIRMPHNEASFV